MRNVANLVAVTEPDDLGKVVLHDSEMVAMVFNVRRQEQRVAAAENQLLAVVRSAPVDFERDLIRLYHFGWIRESFTDLRQKGERSEGGGRVVRQSGVRQLSRATLGRASHQRGHAGIVPLLRGRRRGHSRYQQSGNEASASQSGAGSKHFSTRIENGLRC